MRITDAITNLRHEMLMHGLSTPKVSIPKEDIVGLSLAIERDLGSKIYAGVNRLNGIQFNGVWFVPSDPLPLAQPLACEA